MTELTFSPSGAQPATRPPATRPPAPPPPAPTTAGYAAGRRRSRGALAAAIALNGTVFALILALPPRNMSSTNGPDLVTHWVPIAADPPENRPEPVKRGKAPAKSRFRCRTIPESSRRTRSCRWPATARRRPASWPISATSSASATSRRPIDPPHKAIVRGATRDPRYADAFHPDYPPALRRQGLEGSVTVRVTIDENGRVTAVEMVKANSRAFFEETRDQRCATGASARRRATARPSPRKQTLTVTFNLEDRKGGRGVRPRAMFLRPHLASGMRSAYLGGMAIMPRPVSRETRSPTSSSCSRAIGRIAGACSASPAP